MMSWRLKRGRSYVRKLSDIQTVKQNYFRFATQEFCKTTELSKLGGGRLNGNERLLGVSV